MNKSNKHFYLSVLIHICTLFVPQIIKTITEKGETLFVSENKKTSPDEEV